MKDRVSELFASIIIGLLAILALTENSFAHHSYAPYDIRNPIEFAGIAEEFVYRQPHPMLSLRDEVGVIWDIEIPIRRWQRAGFAQDLIKAGDKLVVKVFAARNGEPRGALSGFTKDGEFYSITERVGQQSGNEAADAIESGEPLEEVLNRYTAPDEESTEPNQRHEQTQETRERTLPATEAPIKVTMENDLNPATTTETIEQLKPAPATKAPSGNMVLWVSLAITLLTMLGLIFRNRKK